MSGKKFKKEKYEEKILNDLNQYLRIGLRDPRLQFATITKVKLNNDFSLAYVYWDTYNEENKDIISTTFDSLSKKIRYELAKIIKVKNVPQLKFMYDIQFESEQKISQLIKDHSNDLSDQQK